MSQHKVVLRIEEICKEFDDRVEIVGVAIARLELAKALAESEAAQQSFAPDVCDARLENHEWVRRDGIEICFHCKRPRR